MLDDETETEKPEAPEEEEELESDDPVASYIGKIQLPEHRRYVALEQAIMAGPLPDKVVDLAIKIDRFLQGKSIRKVEE